MRTLMHFATLFAVLLGCSADQVTNLGPDSTDIPAPHSGFFVAVDGSQTGDGSLAKPWSLPTALAQPGIVQPGDTIWVHGGTYNGPFTSNLAGTAAAPIVLRQYGRERVVIDGRLNIAGQYAYYWGLEITYSDPRRVSLIADSHPADLPRSLVTVSVTGSFNKLINLLVHDLGNGLFAGRDAEGLEIYGSMFYNNGWIGPVDRGYGHNVYLQNQNAKKIVADNILFDSFGMGLHIYGSDVAYLLNFDIDGNTIFNSGDPAGGNYNVIQMGGGGNLGGTVYRNNSIYRSDGRWESIILGFPGSIPGQDIEFSNNIVQGQSWFSNMKKFIVRGNKFTSLETVVGLQMIPGAEYTSNTFTSNKYAAPATVNPFQLRLPVTSVYKFTGWQSATGYDATSSFQAGQFAGADIIVRPNRYEPGRAFVTCWNWDGASALNVDLSNVLKPGDNFEIHHVFDIFGTPVLKGTYGGGSVSIPQATLSPPPPLGYTASPAMPDNRFNVFLVRKR